MATVLCLGAVMEPTAIAYGHLLANYKFLTSNYVLYIFDHVLTFSDEVDKIWSQPLTFATMLFYINRYITHVQYIISNVSYYESTWPISVRLDKCLNVDNVLNWTLGMSFFSSCDRFVAFDGGSTLALVTVAETIMILRVYALYHANKFILIGLMSFVAGQIIVSAWGIHFGKRVPQPEGFPGCVLTGKNNWFAALWGAPMVTDSSIFALTLWKTIRHRKTSGATGRLTTMQIILRDGIMYYFVIFSANFMNMLIYFLAAEDLKAVGAGISQILTAIMINRLQLNLRHIKPNKETNLIETPWRFNSNQRDTATSGLSTGTFFSVGNLGEEMDHSSLDDSTANEDDAGITSQKSDHGHNTFIELQDREVRV